jgi:hypothetical protein
MKIVYLESLCKQQREEISKLQHENVSLELGIQSRNELIEEMTAEMRLDRMGEEDEDDAKGDGTDDTTAATPEDTTEEGNAAPKEEDLEMLVPEHEFLKALEVILP